MNQRPELLDAASTQRPPLAHREVLGKELGWLDDLERAKKPQRLPAVLTRSEIVHDAIHLAFYLDAKGRVCSLSSNL